MRSGQESKQESIARLRARIAAVEPNGRSHTGRSCKECCARDDKPALAQRAVEKDVARKATAHQESPAPSDDPKRTFEGTFKKVERLCLVREQSSVKLTQRLVREGYDARLVDEAIHQAQSWGLLDDARYAEVLVRSRLAAGKGIAGIERELAQCGIVLEEVNGWPEEFEACQASEEERAFAVLLKHPPRSKNLREGAYRKLASKGFSATVSASVARAWAERQD